MYFPPILGAPVHEPAEFLSSLDKGSKNVITCSLCSTLVSEIYEYLENNTVTDEQIVDYVVNICTKLNVYSNPDQVCGGMTSIALVRKLWQSNTFLTLLNVIILLLLKPTVRYIYSTGVVNPGNICGMFLQGERCELSNPEELEWVLDINSENKPSVSQPNQPPVSFPLTISLSSFFVIT